MTSSRKLTAAVRTLVNRVVRRSDVARWASVENLEGFWDSRTRIMAKLIPPGSTVVEVGPGRGLLKELLPPDCTYFSIDLVEGENVTMVADLNADPLPELGDLSPSVGVLGGVLEYMIDLPRTARWIARSFPACIVSYSPASRPTGPFARWSEAYERASLGWMNSLTSDQLKALFVEVGYSVAARREWKGQDIWHFTSTESAGKASQGPLG